MIHENLHVVNVLPLTGAIAALSVLFFMIGGLTEVFSFTLVGAVYEALSLSYFLETLSLPRCYFFIFDFPIPPQCLFLLEEKKAISRPVLSTVLIL